MKSRYVALVRALRAVLRVLGVVRLLDALATRSRTALWLRSLLSIYDLQELLAYDVPWWTFAASDEVARFLDTRPGARAFEWGSGASTLWLARRSGEVVSVEHDAAWAESLRPILPGNVELRVVVPEQKAGTSGIGSSKAGFTDLDFTAYVEAIDGVQGDFDLVVIDGRAREACLPRALERLAPGGVIVFDNVDRQRYVDAISAAGDRIATRTTRGLTPTLPYPTRTALITRP